MSQLLYGWIEGTLGLPLDRGHFEREFASGCRLGEVALRAGMGTEEERASPPFAESADASVVQSNFRALRELLGRHGVPLKAGAERGVRACERGAASSILLQLLDWSREGPPRPPSPPSWETTTGGEPRYMMPYQSNAPRSDYLYSKSDVVAHVRDGSRSVEKTVRAAGAHYEERRVVQEEKGFEALQAFREAHQRMFASLREERLGRDREAATYLKTWDAQCLRSWRDTRHRMTQQEAADLRVELSMLERHRRAVEGVRQRNERDAESSIAGFERNYRQQGFSASDIKDREVTLKTQPPREETPYDQYQRLSAFVSTVSLTRPMRLYEAGIRRRRREAVTEQREREVRRRLQLVAQKQAMERVAAAEEEDESLLRVQERYTAECEAALAYRRDQEQRRQAREEATAQAALMASERAKAAAELQRQFAEECAREREAKESEVTRLIEDHELEKENRRRLKHEDAIRFIRHIPHACADLAMLVSDYCSLKRPKVPPLVWREWKEQLVRGVPFFEDSYTGDPIHLKNWEIELWSDYDYFFFLRSAEAESFLLPTGGRGRLTLMEETPQVWKRLLSPWPPRPPPPRPPVSLGLVAWGAPLSGKSACLREAASVLYLEYWSVERVLEDVARRALSPESSESSSWSARFPSEECQAAMESLVKAFVKLQPAVGKGGASKKASNPLEALEKLRKDPLLVRVLSAMVKHLQSAGESGSGWILEWNLSAEQWLLFSYLTASPSFVESLGKGCESDELFLKKAKGKSFAYPSFSLEEKKTSPWGGSDPFHSYGVVLLGQSVGVSEEKAARAAGLQVSPQSGGLYSRPSSSSAASSGSTPVNGRGPMPVSSTSPMSGRKSTPKSGRTPPLPNPSSVEGGASTGVAESAPFPLASRQADYESLQSGPLGQAYFAAYPPAFVYAEGTLSGRSLVSDLLTVYRRMGWDGKDPDPTFDLETVEGRVESAVHEYMKRTWESTEESVDVGSSEPVGAESYIQELMLTYERIELETEDRFKEGLQRLYRLEQQRESEVSKSTSAILSTLSGGSPGGVKRADSEEQCDEVWSQAYARVEAAKRLVASTECPWVSGLLEASMGAYSTLLEQEVQYWAQWIRLFSMLSYRRGERLSLERLMPLLAPLQARLDSLQRELSPSPLSERALGCLALLYEDLSQLLQELREDARVLKIQAYEEGRKAGQERTLMEASFAESEALETEWRREERERREKEEKTAAQNAVPARGKAEGARKSSIKEAKGGGAAESKKAAGGAGKKTSTVPTPPVPPALTPPPPSEETHPPPPSEPESVPPAVSSGPEATLISMYIRGMEAVARLCQHAEHRLEQLLESPRWIQSLGHMWIESRVRSESERVDAIRELPAGAPLPPYDFDDSGYRQGVRPLLQSLIPSPPSLLRWSEQWGRATLTDWECEAWFREGAKAGLLPAECLPLFDSSTFVRIGKALCRESSPGSYSFSLKDVVLDLLLTKYGLPETKYLLKLFSSLRYKDSTGTGTVELRDLSKEFLWFACSDEERSAFWLLVSYLYSLEGASLSGSVPYLDFVFHLCCRESRPAQAARHTGLYAAALVASRMLNLVPGNVSFASLTEMVRREPGRRAEHLPDSIWDELQLSREEEVPFFVLCESRLLQMLVERGFYRFSNCLQL